MELLAVHPQHPHIQEDVVELRVVLYLEKSFFGAGRQLYRMAFDSQDTANDIPNVFFVGSTSSTHKSSKGWMV